MTDIIDERPVYPIGVVSRLLDVHPETIRGWEHSGIIRVSRINKRRYFSQNDLKRLRFAQKMMNEIQELKASLSQSSNHSVSLSAAAYHWLTTIYEPTIERLEPIVKADFGTAELYCQILEHKWYLSEKARRDVGHTRAIEDYLENIATQ